MLEADQIDDLICAVAAFDRETLMHAFREVPSRFPIDFTPEFLATTPLDHLRHVFVALCLQCKHVPALEAQTAA